MSRALLQAWARTVRRRRDDRAVVQAADGSGVSFGELDERAEAWLEKVTGDSAAGSPRLQDLRGRALVFALPNGMEWLEVFLGLLKAGAVAVPLDAGEPAAARQALAASIRAGFLWDGTRLVTLGGARHYRDPAVCLIKVTSGSTGRPRALVFTAEQVMADARQVAATMGLGPRDLNYALIPLGHSYGLGNLTIPLLVRGVPLVCGSASLPHAIAADFVRWRPTVFPGVPAMWRALAASDVKLESLRLAISAGAPLPPEVARDFAARLGRRLHSFYGSSETGGIAYDRTGRGALDGTVGRALRGVKLAGKKGRRLQVSSPAVLTHGNRRGGTWLMPDRVQLDASGEVTLLGRRGTTVKIAGRRVNLNEVAGRLRRLAGVGDVWVGVREGSDPVLGAVIATGRSPAELRADLLADTAPWKVPKKLFCVAALPLTARGKADVPAMRAMVFPE